MRIFLLLVLILKFFPASYGQATPQVPEYSSLEPFVRGEALYTATPGITVYRVHTKKIQTHIHHEPFLIVWIDDGVIEEQELGSHAEARTIFAGEMDFYPAGTIHSLKGKKGSMRFTLVELRGQLTSVSVPRIRRPEECERLTELPLHGFACLIRIGPNQQVTIPEAGFDSIVVVVDSGKLSNTLLSDRDKFTTNWRYQKGRFFPSSNSKLVNLENRPIRLVLVVPAG